MPKKKSANTTKTATKKKSTTKKSVKKKVKAKTTSKKKEEINPSDFLQKENENQLKSLITKEFDKELTDKSSAYIKSFVKIEDSIISVNDFLNYVENLDEDLFKLFKAYTNSSDNDISSSSDDSEEEEKSTSVKSDDPVRMYLKEMGNVELLSREGEIAIAKRIESGLDKMMNSILECPASIDILKKWIDQVKLQEINLREIVDFDEYFNEENDPYSNSSKRKEIQKIINDKKKALLKEKQQLMKEQGIEIDKEKLQETSNEEDIENESFSISIIEEFYKPEILKKLDRVLIHKFWGYLIFFSILMIIFQSIFSWSEVPMDFIDNTFVSLSQSVKLNLPDGVFTSLLAEGVIPGLAGIIIFVPQIALLFFFISILEETGYMSRVVFLMDRTLRKFGLGGKSLIPLVSGVACAIPAVMATRNIENWKDRLITILVIPFMTCSARLPVYLILISLVIPSDKIFGINYQSLTLMGLYILGFLMAIISSSILKSIIKRDSKSYLVLEMPEYKLPLFKNIFLTVYTKTNSFIVEAGKIIFAISILLWIMASTGPGNNFKNADQIVKNQYENIEISDEELDINIEAFKLEHSYIGLVGKSIEPIISPLGYDWKIGIALVTSFAAREVFVGTLSTIYSVGSENQETIKNTMAQEKDSSGNKIFSLPTGLSLMIFYAFAMQCMSTLAIVKKETNSWKWPMAQLFFMTSLAYFASLFVYQILA